MGEAAVENRGDWPFVQNGAVTLFLREEVLAGARDAMVKCGYSVRDIDCGTDESLVRDLAHALNWSENFGYMPSRLNLDALNDALGYEPLASSPKLLLVFNRFADFLKRSEDSAKGLLDVVEYQARNHLLLGQRLVAFVHTNDPRLQIEGLGGRVTHWNAAEWSAKSRGV
jgi:hypothetical protein